MAHGEITVRVADARSLRPLLDAVCALLDEIAEADDEHYDVQVQRVEAALAALTAGKD